MVVVVVAVVIVVVAVVVIVVVVSLLLITSQCNIYFLLSFLVCIIVSFLDTFYQVTVWEKYLYGARTQMDGTNC